ncbi:hypothetical protein HKBW3S44_00625 [Candidatus Hakubella thermalkaliphila]|uniref:Uncharacterized protein n=1 Tax=Candidatus Hakubella thermalkaliphila TaxID=2754717 RepID=A0A6V8PYQ6_9ACTN|nr:hypothetical protein HKBW3S44_00625 [Candidatus Hakubella thermalkaliphila]
MATDRVIIATDWDLPFLTRDNFSHCVEQCGIYLPLRVSSQRNGS